jgi:hypothetical protein
MTTRCIVRSFRQTLSRSAIVGLIVACLAWSAVARADMTTTSEIFPPLGACYEGWTADYDNGVAIKNATITQFSPSFSLPVPGGGTDYHDSAAVVAGWYSINGGTSLPFFAPAHLTIGILDHGGAGDTRNFLTQINEMLVSGGTLPSGMVITESPIFGYNGDLTVTNNRDGTYGMSSNFTLYTQLSTNGGTNWSSISSSGVVLVPDLSTFPEPNTLTLLIIGGLTVLAYTRRAKGGQAPHRFGFRSTPRSVTGLPDSRSLTLP